MTNFVQKLCLLRSELWFEESGSVPEIEKMLADLSFSPLPPGVVRLRSAGFFAGPHLEPQTADSTADNILPFAGRSL